MAGGGFSERQRAKMQSRMQATAGQHLKGQQPKVAVYAYRVNYRILIPLVVVLIAVQVTLSLQGVELRPWVIGAIAGGGSVLLNRFYHLLLTDDRLVVVRASAFSTKKTALDEEIPLHSITGAKYSDGFLGGRLDLEVNGESRRYSVGRPFRPGAESLGQQLSRGHS